MKRTLTLITFALLMLPCLAHADNLDDQIAAAQKELDGHLQKRNDMAEAFKKFDQKKSDIEFAADAYKKQSAKLDQEYNDLTMRKNDCDAKAQPIEADIDALNARITAHNANRCVEKCDSNGACDGSCAWYTQEQATLNAKASALDAQYAPIKSERQQIASEGQQLATNAGLLEQIRQNVTSDTEAWVAGVKAFKDEWDENERQISVLQNTIAHLRDLKASFDSCVKAIPPECDNPFTDDLKTKCEVMHATCGHIFDGN